MPFTFKLSKRSGVGRVPQGTASLDAAQSKPVERRRRRATGLRRNGHARRAASEIDTTRRGLAALLYCAPEGNAMPFKFKLSVRLALMKDAMALTSLAGSAPVKSPLQSPAPVPS